MTCPQCGASFTPRDRFQVCCSKACGRKRWNAGDSAANRSGGRDITVTFTDAEGRQVTRRGRGRLPAWARRDARAQLPAGFVPVSEYTSSVATILKSLERSSG